MPEADENRRKRWRGGANSPEATLPELAPSVGYGVREIPISAVDRLVWPRGAFAFRTIFIYISEVCVRQKCASVGDRAAHAGRGCPEWGSPD